MNWLSYSRIDMKTLIPYSSMIIVGSQRQSIRDTIRCIEPPIQRTLILDNMDYHGTYIHTHNPLEDLYAHYHPSFLQKIQNLPPDSMIVMDISLLPRDFVQNHLPLILSQRKERKWTIALIFSQMLSIPSWIAQSCDYAFLHRVTSNDQAFRLFGRFFPDMQEFLYGVEQYAKYYEALVIDHIHQRAHWYRPSHF